MIANPNELVMQAFRGLSTDRIINISTMMDEETGQYAVLWSDIQNMFKNAESVKNGEALVSFMTDGDSRTILPLKIAYHPGVVLEVVEGTDGQVDTSMGMTSCTKPTRTTDTTLATLNAVATAFANINTKSDSVNTDHRRSSEAHQSSLSIYNQLYDSYRQVVLSEQEMKEKSFKKSIRDSFQRFQKEMDRNKTLQKYLVNVEQQQQLQLQQEAIEELKRQKMMEEEQERARQALNRLATIQNRSRELLLHKYELHEGSIPRLFVVLPRATGLYNHPTRPIADQFRLYFLCECGTHTTMYDDCKSPHEIHLAKHEGYDLDKPTEFFQKYGAYLLAMMHMIKHGAAATGMTVPPLADLNIPDDVADDPKDVEYIRSNIESLVDDTIDYLQALSPKTGPDTELNVGQRPFNKIESLKNADMLQLESHLKGRVSGNMYRIANSDGYVKWVCYDHYLSSHQESAVQQLRDIVEAHEGTYTEAVGRIEIKVRCDIQAGRFYDALIKAQVIQELRITIGWSATMFDLRMLANAVTMGNLLHLAMDGTYSIGPAIDIFNRYRRFNPILTNSRLQSLHLKNFHNFFARISDSALVPVPKLRMFAMDPKVPSNPKLFKSLNNFLDHCPSLAIVMLKLHDQYSITEAINDLLGKLHKLESLYIDSSNISLVAGVSESKIQNTVVKVKRLDGLSKDDLKFIHQGHLTQLQIEHTPQEADEDGLLDALRLNPQLNLLEVGCDDARYLVVINLVVTTRAALLQKQGSCRLRSFILMEDGLVPFDERGNFNDKTHLSARITFAEESLDFEMHTWLRVQDRKPISGDDPIYDFLSEYGWSIVDFRVAGTTTDNLFATLADVTSRRGSELERIVLYPLCLPDSALDHLDQVIRRSPNFLGLGLLFYQLGWKPVGRIERALQLLRRYRRVLFGLLMHGDSEDEWLPQFASSFPTRDIFPHMTSFTITSNNSFSVAPDCFDWILTMITTPPPEEQLKKITVFQLQGITLGPEDWRTLIETLDTSTLEQLSFAFSNVAEKQFHLLLNRFFNNEESNLPLKTFRISGTDVVRKTDPSVMEASFAKLRQKAPSVTITK